MYFFTNLDIVDEAWTSIPEYLWSNLLHDLYDVFVT
jgi:hypothetical protein